MIRLINATIRDNNLSVVPNAVCYVRLVIVSGQLQSGLSTEPVKSVADAFGNVAFNLNQNQSSVNQSFYIFDSYNPKTGNKIHSGLRFFVRDSDSNLFDLLITGDDRLDFNVFRPSVSSSMLTAVINNQKSFYLGDKYDRAGALNVYSTTSKLVTIFGNIATFNSNEFGVHLVRVNCKTSYHVDAVSDFNVVVVPDDVLFEGVYFGLVVTSDPLVGQFEWPFISVVS